MNIGPEFLRGKVLVHTYLMLAGGGESCADIEHLRLQSDLFGSGPLGLDGVPHLSPLP